MAYVIDITANSAPAVSGITKLLHVLDRLERTMARINGGLASMGNISPAITPARAGGGGGGRGQLSPLPGQIFNFYNAQNRISGGQFAQQRQAAAHAAYSYYSNQFMGGNFAAASGMNRFAGILAPKKSGFWSSPVGQLVASTRFGVGGGAASPLVGRTLQAISSLGPAGVAASAALSGVAAAGYVAMRAMETMSKAASLKFSTGATFGEASKLAGMGYFLGDMNSRISGAMDAFSGGGAGSWAAAMAGISPTSGPFSTNRNEGGKYLKFIEKLLSVDDTTADRMAQAIGQRDLVGLRYLTKDQQKRFMGGMNMSRDEVISGHRAKAEFAMLGREWDKFVTSLGKTFIPILTKSVQLLNMLLGWMEKLTSWYDKISKTSSVSGTRAMTGHNPRVGSTGSNLMDSMNDAIENINKARQNGLNENTKALADNTRAMGKMREVLGGGERARRALPSRLGGSNLNNDAYMAGLNAGLI